MESDAGRQLFGNQSELVEDFNREMSGTQTGRIERFGIGRKRKDQLAAERRSERLQSELSALLEDHTYLRAYEGAWDAWREAESATEAALAEIAAEIIVARRINDDLLDAAPSLADGRKVFRDAHGNVRDQDGQIVTHLAAHIIWTGNESSFEEHEAANAALDRLLEEEREIQAYQVEVLGAGREALSDEDNPQTLEGLEALSDGFTERAPDRVKKHLENDAEVSVRPSIGALPTLSL